MTESLLDLLRCPQTGRPLSVQGSLQGDRLTGMLQAHNTGVTWPSSAGFIKLFREREIQGTDRVLRWFYDSAPRLHDPAVKWLLPLFQGGQTENETRSGYWPLLELEQAEAPVGRDFRVLEVGVGSGANLEGFARRLPGGRGTHIVGLDISEGMLRLCRQRPCPSHPDMQVSLLLGDAHSLPFDDGVFDRVLHVGATGSFRDPAKALSEMARVAKPGAPIVVVDEQIDPREQHGFIARAAFKALTFYDSAPKSPQHLLPEDTYDVFEWQISRFYYALRFRRQAPPGEGESATAD